MLRDKTKWESKMFLMEFIHQIDGRKNNNDSNVNFVYCSL